MTLFSPRQQLIGGQCPGAASPCQTTASIVGRTRHYVVTTSVEPAGSLDVVAFEMTTQWLVGLCDRWLLLGGAAAAGTGYILTRTSLSPLLQDVLAFFAGCVLAVVALAARSVAFVMTAPPRSGRGTLRHRYATEYVPSGVGVWSARGRLRRCAPPQLARCCEHTDRTGCTASGGRTDSGTTLRPHSLNLLLASQVRPVHRRGRRCEHEHATRRAHGCARPRGRLF